MSMRSIYRKIAKKHGVSVSEVKRNMQAALDHAYTHTPDDGITGAYQEQVPHKGEVPTPDEFIRYAVTKMKNK